MNLRRTYQEVEIGTTVISVDLAKRVGVSEMTIVNWEKGRTKPTKQYFKRLEKILGDFTSSY